MAQPRGDGLWGSTGISHPLPPHRAVVKQELLPKHESVFGHLNILRSVFFLFFLSCYAVHQKAQIQFQEET